MNSEIAVCGSQNFMDTNIPVVIGGFGPDAKCICDKTVAEIHGMEPKNVRARITDNLGRFRENVDYIDLGQRACQISTLDLLAELGYAKQSIAQAAHIYLLSERGYAKLVKIMDTDQAWDIYEHLLDEYFLCREIARKAINVSELSPELQMIKAMWEGMARTELEQKRQAKAIAEVSQKVESIKDVVSLNTENWRTEGRALITKIAQAKGGTYKEVYQDVFTLVNQRAGVSLDVRLTNKRRRSAEEGVCKSKRDQLTKIDVIADDKKLIEIYIAIVKEMEIAEGIYPDDEVA